MTKSTFNGTEIELCELCGIRRIDGIFYFSHNNSVTAPNKLFSRVCTHIQDDSDKKSLCINTKGELRDEYTYKGVESEIEYGINRLLN